MYSAKKKKQPQQPKYRKHLAHTLMSLETALFILKELK